MAADNLFEPGGRDGQQKTARTGGAVSVNSWNMAEQNLDKMVGAAGGSTETGSGIKRPWFDDHPTTVLERAAKMFGLEKPEFHVLECKRVGGARATSSVQLIFNQKIYEGRYKLIQLTP